MKLFQNIGSTLFCVCLFTLLVCKPKTNLTATTNFKAVDSAPASLSTSELRQWFYSQPKTTRNNRIVGLRDGKSSFEKRLEVMRSAKESISMSYYSIQNFFFQNKSFLDQMCEIIAAKKNLDVRLLLSPVIGAGKSEDEKILQQLKNCGVRVLYPQKGFNHIKYTMSDGIRLVFGGSNISTEQAEFRRSDDYLSGALKDVTDPSIFRSMLSYTIASKWYDYDVFLEGEAACQIQQQFDETWDKALSSSNDVSNSKFVSKKCLPLKEQYGHSAVLPILSYPSIDASKSPISEAYIAAIGHSKNTINFWAPYFIPWPALTEAVVNKINTAKVSVTVITNSTKSTDEGMYGEIIEACMARYAKPWKDAKANIFSFKRKQTMHRKGGIFDNELAYFGSENISAWGLQEAMEGIMFTDEPDILLDMILDYPRDVKLAENINNSWPPEPPTFSWANVVCREN